jgi:uncharacterized protein DUF11/PASTA domain-containing protein
MGAKQVVGSLFRRVWLAAGIAGSILVMLAAATGARAEAVGGFQNLAPSPEPVTAVAADPTTDKIYAQGNDDTTFYKYDPATNAWTSLAPATLSSGNNGGGAVLNGKIYTSYTGNDAQIGVYDIASDTWSTLPNPLALGTADITAVGGLIYMVDDNSFVSFNPVTNTTKTLADVPDFIGESDCTGEGFTRFGAIAAFAGKIYGTQGDGCNGFAVYDIASNKWSQLPNVPMGGAVLGGAIDPVTGVYIAYGDYEEDNLYSYEIASNSWSTTTFPFDDIDDGGMAFVSGPGSLQGVYAVEGENNPGFTRYTLFQDASVGGAAGPANATAGFPALLSSTVSSAGPASGPVDFTDHVPAGLTIAAAIAGNGACASSGQVVNCTITRLAPGQSTPVSIVVTPTSAGTYANSMSVAAGHGVIESNPANNSASATLSVAPKSVAPSCVVPALKLTPVSVAKRVLNLLNCKAGKVGHAHSKSVRKGLVIKTSPKPGTYASGKVIGLQVSSGAKPKKHKKHKK